MGEKKTRRNVIIHGHFYQPPRENPWTDRIDRQAGAAPYHDWNERICRECYDPNSRSRRLDGYGRVTGLVNNYEHMSFNFGPTLLSWIEKECPGLYGRIIEADISSARRCGGHGNAIAQVYNHLIMPLADPEDQKTQVIWGVHDFERRFSRRPEGIWLAETAVNEAVLEMLIDHGFRFIILSPHQAERYRRLDGSASWKTVSAGAMPTGMAYRCFGARKKGKRSAGRFIDIFFYDAQLSTDVSFNHLLRNGDNLALSIAGSFERCGGDLVTIATDGEIYGHHEPFGDMAMAYLAGSAAAANGLLLTNFGEYLDSHEPGFEVQIKQGKNGEGTAWSCPHGMGRWKEDCGCSVGAPAGWNQEWRSPLRKGLDSLRAELAGIFSREGGALLTDPLQARNEYISVIEKRSAGGIAKFVRERASRELAGEEVSRASALLESQRHSMLMFTSCGWFFNDISGIETVKLLEYAARAIELAGPPRAGLLEKDLLSFLEKASSNIPGIGTGRDIYLRAKGSSSVTPAFLAGQHLVSAFLDCPGASPSAFGYLFEETERSVIGLGGSSVVIGRLFVTSPYDLSRKGFEYIIVPGSPSSKITCLIKEDTGAPLEASRKFFSGLPADTGRADLLRAAVERFGAHVFSMRDLFAEDREAILEVLSSRQIESEISVFSDLYMENRELLRLYGEVAIDPPESLLAPARTVLTARLEEAVREWRGTFGNGGLDSIRQVVSEARYYAIPLDRRAASRILTDFFLFKLRSLEGSLDAETSRNLYELAQFCAEMKIEIPQHEIQNELYSILEAAAEEADRRRAAATPPAIDRDAADSFLELARRFNFNTDRWQERLP